MKSAIYTASLDPITRGHLDIIRQGLEIFDFIHVLIGINFGKDGKFFDYNDRVTLSVDSINEYFNKDMRDQINVRLLTGLVAKEAESLNIKHIIRGLRASSDFDYEFMMNGTNAKISPFVTTIFFMPPPNFMFVSSSTVREIAIRDHDADLSWLVTPYVEKAVKERINILKHI